MHKLKNYFYVFCLLFILVGTAYAQGGGFGGLFADRASKIKTDTTNFNGNLSTADTNVQAALDTIDEMASGGGGGGSISVQLNDINVATQTSTLDLSSFFSATESPANETNVSLAWLSSATATAGNLLVGNGTKFDAVATSGDISLASSGALTIQNDSVQADDIDFMNSSTTTAGNIFIADGTGFNAILMSGDVTMTSAGVTAVGADKVALTTDTTGNYVQSITNGSGITGGDGGSEGAALTIAATLGTSITASETDFINSSTATLGNVLIGNGTKFDAVALGTDAAITSTGSLTINDNAIQDSDIDFMNSSTTTSGRILVADGTGFNSVEVGGDCTILSTGAMSCSGGTGATQLTDLVDVNSSTATRGNLLVGTGSDFVSSSSLYVPPSGNIGIGTTAPSQKLEVEGSISAVAFIADPSATPSSSYIDSDTTDGDTSTQIITNCTNTGSGTENCDLTLKQQIVGVLTDAITLDADGPITFGRKFGLSGGNFNSMTATSGRILVADGSGFNSVTMSGDVAIISTGASTIQANSIGSSEIDFMNSSTTTSGRMLIADGTGFNSVDMSGSCTILSTGAISCSGSATALIDLTDVNSSTATSGNLLMADGTSWHSVNPSGDVETAWSGTTTIQDDSVQGDDIDFINASTATAGNLFVGEGAGYNALTIGSNAQVLTVDTSIARKVKWATPSAGGGGATNLTLSAKDVKLSGAFVTMTPAGCSSTASTATALIDGGSGAWKALLNDGSVTDDAIVWQFVMPSNYSSTPTLDVHFAMASGEANEVEFEGAIMCYTPTTDTADIDAASFADCALGTATTVSATAGEVYSQTITLTDDSCASGDDVFIWVSTDADDATNDDATGNREIINVEFGYTGS